MTTPVCALPYFIKIVVKMGFFYSQNAAINGTAYCVRLLALLGVWVATPAHRFDIVTFWIKHVG